MALKRRGQLHHLLGVQRIAGQAIGRQHARRSGGCRRAQAARLRNHVGALHPQTRRADPRCGQARLDGAHYQVRGVPGKIIGSLAVDDDLQAGLGDLHGHRVIHAHRQAQGVKARAQIRRGRRNLHRDGAADLNVNAHFIDLLPYSLPDCLTYSASLMTLSTDNTSADALKAATVSARSRSAAVWVTRISRAVSPDSSWRTVRKEIPRLAQMAETSASTPMRSRTTMSM